MDSLEGGILSGETGSVRHIRHMGTSERRGGSKTSEIGDPIHSVPALLSRTTGALKTHIRISQSHQVQKSPRRPSKLGSACELHDLSGTHLAVSFSIFGMITSPCSRSSSTMSP